MHAFFQASDQWLLSENASAGRFLGKGSCLTQKILWSVDFFQVGGQLFDGQYVTWFYSHWATFFCQGPIQATMDHLFLGKLQLLSVVIKHKLGLLWKADMKLGWKERIIGCIKKSTTTGAIQTGRAFAAPIYPYFANPNHVACLLKQFSQRDYQIQENFKSLSNWLKTILNAI
ncbi:MAG TPA: hypothetical protein PK843_07960 [bacterium]|nr:hypothetical protein [bacterium]HPN34432.1 hypothetical protein [bacterium]